MSEENQVKQLREIMRMLVRRLGILERGEASCCGITLAQCHVLVELGRAGRMSVNNLAESLRLDKSTASRTVDNLVNTGLVVREPDPEDRRYVTLGLSGQGGRVYVDLEDRMEAYFGDIIRQLPEEKREQVIESLLLLSEAITSPECCYIGFDSEGCARKEG